MTSQEKFDNALVDKVAKKDLDSVYELVDARIAELMAEKERDILEAMELYREGLADKNTISDQHFRVMVNAIFGCKILIKEAFKTKQK